MWTIDKETEAAFQRHLESSCSNQSWKAYCVNTETGESAHVLARGVRFDDKGGVLTYTIKHEGRMKIVDGSRVVSRLMKE